MTVYGLQRPKWLLLVLLVIFLLATLALVPYVLHLRRKAQAVTTELEALKAKPKYPYKFGVKWDEEFNPLCPHCEAYLTGYQYLKLQTMPDQSRFLCGGCGRTVLMADRDADPIQFWEAKEEMVAQAKKRLDP